MDILNKSKSGMSGVEISEELDINRITMTKYLSIFAAEGLIRQKNIGNVTLWFVDGGLEQYDFPDDYFKIKSKYFDLLISGPEIQPVSLIRSCLHSGATVKKLVSEVIVPAISGIRKLYDSGKIGNSEYSLLRNIITKSIQEFSHTPAEINPKKNVIVISADSQSTLLAEAASASLRSDGWNVFYLGDMSSSINVLFDLDLQKLVGKIWKQKQGIMIVSVFSDTEEGLNFFAESINSLKEKIGKNLYLSLCGKTSKKLEIKSDLLSEKLDEVIQWSETVFESSET